MADSIRVISEIEPVITDALGAAAVLEVLSEQLFSTKPVDGSTWRLSNVEVDALRFAIRTANSAIDAIDGAHRALCDRGRAQVGADG